MMPVLPSSCGRHGKLLVHGAASLISPPPALEEGFVGVRHSATFAQHGTDKVSAGSTSVDPHPHPAWPAALASTSWTQQASLSAGAGPPQQEAASTSVRGWKTVGPDGRALQTPVSGSVSSTRVAASRSPARA